MVEVLGLMFVGLKIRYATVAPGHDEMTPRGYPEGKLDLAIRPFCLSARFDGCHSLML